MSAATGSKQVRRRHPRRHRLDRDAAHLRLESARRHPLRHLGRAGAGLRAARSWTRRAATSADGEIGEMLVRGPTAAEGYWNQREKSRAHVRGRVDAHRRQIHARWRRLLRLCRAHRRHVQGLRHLGLAVRGRERADHTKRCSKRRWCRQADARGALEAEGVSSCSRTGASGDGGLVGALQEHVKAEAGPWKYPRWIEFADALPKTATGKIQRFKLRDA